MNDDVHDFGKPLQEPIFDDVRERVGFTEGRVRVHPQVQIDEHGIRRAARTNLLGADDAGHRFHDGTDVVLGEDDMVRENA